MDYCVFIHTNHKQALGAKVAAYALTRNSDHAERFAIRILHADDYSWLRSYDGKTYLRDGLQRTWLYDDLQSFTPLRFLPPQLMNYQGRAILIDPDVFAIDDIWALLNRDMQGKAIMCRKRFGAALGLSQCQATSVMLLDNSQLKHWNAEKSFAALFTGELDYRDWICLHNEPAKNIGYFENEWNDFDRLTSATKMLHNTRRATQPWKTGLPIDWRVAERFLLIKWFFVLKRKLLGEYALLGSYRRHPDKNQQQLFFGLLKECLNKNIITAEELQTEIAANHIRHDALDLIESTEPLQVWPNFPIKSILRLAS